MSQNLNAVAIRENISKLFPQKNPNALPRFTKIAINCRVPEARESQETLLSAQSEIMAITGLKPQVCQAKKSIASFKVRERDPLAVKVTLRGKHLYDFLDKLVNVVLPRLRDFKGMSADAFDSHGNYNLTIRDQTYFPEIDLDKVNKIRSVQITLNIHASSKDDAKMLLSSIGFPFKKTN